MTTQQANEDLFSATREAYRGAKTGTGGPDGTEYKHKKWIRKATISQPIEAQPAVLIYMHTLVCSLVIDYPVQSHTPDALGRLTVEQRGFQQFARIGCRSDRL